MAEKQDQDRPFRLLDLPPELWSRICAFAVSGLGPVIIWGREHGTFTQKLYDHHKQALKQPPLTHTCRAVRNKALPRFYQTNTFILVDNSANIDAVLGWLDAIGPTYRHLLRIYVASTEREDGPPYFGHNAKLARYGAIFERVDLHGWRDRTYAKVHKVTLVD